MMLKIQAKLKKKTTTKKNKATTVTFVFRLSIVNSPNRLPLIVPLVAASSNTSLTLTSSRQSTKQEGKLSVDER